MALYTVTLNDVTGPDVVSLTDGSTYATLEVSAGRGPKGDGWTGVTYDNGTGRFTFTSTDGLGYVSDSITSDLDTAVTEAEAAQAAAEAAQAATENIFDQFGDQYLGPKASDPTVDNDGDPLTEGDIYFNTTDSVLKFYSGTAWVAPESIATTAASDAQAAQTASEAAQAAAETAETNAETAETNAAASASSASSSASAASTSASEAAASAASINLSSIDIDGGTIDGTVIGGSVPAAGSFTTGSFTGDVAHGDNVKATFGNSADLQVFHDGSRSLISDQGTGNLVIRAGDFTVQNPEGTETFIQATRNGSVDLYYDQGTYTTPKLQTTSSGINVTGTVVADGATFDGAVSVGLTQGDISLEDLNNQAADTDAGIILNGGGTIRSGMFTEVDGEILSYAINMPQIDASYDQTRSGGNFRLDTRSTENVFVVKRRAENSTSISSAIEISLNDGSTHLFGDLQVDGSVELNGWTITESGGSLYFATGGTNKMKLDASGNLDVVGSVNSNATIT